MKTRTFPLLTLCLILLPGASRAEVEVETGKSFFGLVDDLFSSGTGKIFTANWVEVRFQRFFHLGVHQSDDMTKGTACKVAPALAGKRFCSTADFELDSGARFTAVFAGMQTELVELIGRERKPVRIFLGGGGTYFRSTFFSSRARPYISLEFTSELEKRLEARAGFFLSPIQETANFGAAVPEMTLLFRF